MTTNIVIIIINILRSRGGLAMVEGGRLPLESVKFWADKSKLNKHKIGYLDKQLLLLVVNYLPISRMSE